MVARSRARLVADEVRVRPASKAAMSRRRSSSMVGLIGFVVYL